MVSQVWLGESRESPFWLAGQVWFQVLGTRAQVVGEDRVRSADGQPPSWAWSSCLRDLLGCTHPPPPPRNSCSCSLEALFAPQLGTRV